MDRYPSFVKHLVLSLAFLHTMTGGHLVCYAHSHFAQPSQHGQHCDHPHHQSPGIQQPLCCQDCPNDYKHICNGQRAVRTLRSIIDEAEQLISVSLSACVSIVPVMIPPVLSAAVAVYPSVGSLRLHLFYGVLLI